jgi:hypothetical protein
VPRVDVSPTSISGQVAKAMTPPGFRTRIISAIVTSGLGANMWRMTKHNIELTSAEREILGITFTPAHLAPGDSGIFKRALQQPWCQIDA